MADLAVTPSQVQPGTGTQYDYFGLAGATITAGQIVYKDSTTTPANKYKPADSDLSAAAATVYGMAMHGASDGQPLVVATSGEVILGAGAAPTAGTPYYASKTNAGGLICPFADLTAGCFVVQIGYGKAGNKIQLGIQN